MQFPEQNNHRSQGSAQEVCINTEFNDAMLTSVIKSNKIFIYDPQQPYPIEIASSNRNSLRKTPSRKNTWFFLFYNSFDFMFCLYPPHIISFKLLKFQTILVKNQQLEEHYLPYNCRIITR